MLVLLLKGGEIMIGSCDRDCRHLCSTMRHGHEGLDSVCQTHCSGFLSKRPSFSQDEGHMERSQVVEDKKRQHLDADC